MIAPGSVVVFTNIDFHLLGIHINKYNFIGIFMAIVMVFYTIACFFFLPNCTLHPGYQIFLHKIKNKKMKYKVEISSPSSKVNSKVRKGLKDFETKSSEKQVIDSSIKSTIKTDDSSMELSAEKPFVEKHTVKDLLNATKSTTMTANFALMMVACFTSGFVFTETEITTNLIAMYVFEWSLTMLCTVTLFCAVATIIVMKFIQRYRGAANIYFMFLMSVVLNNAIVCLQLVTIHAQFKSKFIQVAVIVSCFFFNTTLGCNTVSWARYILFSLASPEIASTVDGIRFLFYCFGLFSGFFLASYIFHDGFYGFLLTSITCLSIYLGLIIRKSHIISKSE